MLRDIVSFYGEELLAPHPNPKLEDHPLSAVRECLFSIQADSRIHGLQRSDKNLENDRNKRFIICKTRAKRERAVTW